MSHNQDEHIQITIADSKTTFIREKESGRLLVDNQQTLVRPGNVESVSVTDLETNALLCDILAELKKQTIHLELITGQEKLS